MLRSLPSFMLIGILVSLMTPSHGMFLFGGIRQYLCQESLIPPQELSENKSDNSLQSMVPLAEAEKLCEVHHQSVIKNSSSSLSQNSKTYASNFLDITSPFISVFVNSTYLNPKMIPSKEESMYVLDGGIIKRYVIQDKVFYGIGFGDGYSGHMDALEDKDIASMSRHAPEIILDIAVNNLASRKEVEISDIREQFYSAFIQGASKLRNSKEYKRSQAGTTVSCSLIFECEDGYQIIGFNYGDQRISKVAKNRKKQWEFQALSEGGLVSYVPKYPDLIGPVNIEYLAFEHILKSGDFLVYSTDGVVLPETQVREDSTGLNVKTLESEKISKALRKVAIHTAQDVNIALVINYSHAFINNNRKEKLRQGIADGDDVLSIVLGPIDSEMFSIDNEFTSIKGKI